jgi:oligogalacturonide lyase
MAALLVSVAGGVRISATDEPRTDWIDPDTGHRIIRLSTEPGSQTLYFHDNAYTPDGDKYVFSSPSGIMLIDVTTLGKSPPKPELVVPSAGGAYAARRTREIYFSRRAAGLPRGAGGGEVFAYDVDSKAIRPVPNARRTLINADETFTGAAIAAEDPPGKTPRPPQREARPQLERMFPGKTMAELTPEQQYAVTKEDGLARRALNPEPMAFVFTNLKTA